jgi:hypothetical protein
MRSERYSWSQNTLNEILYYFRKAKSSVRSIGVGLVNLWLFRKVIWNFRGWDYAYTLQIWIKTLELQEKDIRSCTFMESNEKDASNIRTARLLLQRVMDRNEHHKDEDLYDFLKPTKIPLNKDRADLDLFGQIIAKHVLRWWT